MSLLIYKTKNIHRWNLIWIIFCVRFKNLSQNLKRERTRNGWISWQNLRRICETVFLCLNWNIIFVSEFITNFAMELDIVQICHLCLWFHLRISFFFFKCYKLKKQLLRKKEFLIIKTIIRANIKNIILIKY